MSVTCTLTLGNIRQTKALRKRNHCPLTNEDWKLRLFGRNGKLFIRKHNNIEEDISDAIKGNVRNELKFSHF